MESFHLTRDQIRALQVAANREPIDDLLASTIGYPEFNLITKSYDILVLNNMAHIIWELNKIIKKYFEPDVVEDLDQVLSWQC